LPHETINSMNTTTNSFRSRNNIIAGVLLVAAAAVIALGTAGAGHAETVDPAPIRGAAATVHTAPGLPRTRSVGCKSPWHSTPAQRQRCRRDR
jgi:hypothetical protein